MRRAVNPLREPMKRFATGSVAFVSQESSPFFRDVADHVIRVSETIETLDSLLSTAFDAHLARISVQQNEDMRKISAWVAIAAVGTLVAGVYGMNFDNMPGAALALRLLLRARADAGRQRRALPVLQEVGLALTPTRRPTWRGHRRVTQDGDGSIPQVAVIQPAESATISRTPRPTR